MLVDLIRTIQRATITTFCQCKTMRLFAMIPLICVVFSVDAAAQTLVFDPQSGNYSLTYTDDLGDTYTIEVQSPARVRPRIQVVVAERDGGFEYWYRISNGSELPSSGIADTFIPCGAEQHSISLAAPEVGAGNYWIVHTFDRDGVRYCGFSGYGTTIPPGSEVDGFIIRSDALAAIDTALISAEFEMPKWMSLEGTVPERAYELVDSVQSFGASSKVAVVLPKRLPSALSDSAAVLAALLEDITATCAMSWVVDAEVCSELSGEVSSARAAWASDHVPGARVALDRFLAVLQAGRSNGVINENAYALLVTVGRHVRYKVLPPVACGEISSIRLVAGQTLNVGTVSTWNDAGTLFVRYTLSNGWSLAETHLAAALSVNGIPTNKAGNPIIGQFPQQQTHSAGTTNYTYEIPLIELGAGAGDDLLIAAHGTVSGPSGNETAWGDGARFTQQGSWAMYFAYRVLLCGG
jgi:hypothetical protein